MRSVSLFVRHEQAITWELIADVLLENSNPHFSIKKQAKNSFMKSTL